jgi:hypothetical protein
MQLVEHIERPQRRCNVVGGLIASIVAITAGAIMDYAVTTSPYQHGFNVHTVGVILMIVGFVGAALSIVGLLTSSFHRRHTVVDDGQGNVVRRDDTFI